MSDHDSGGGGGHPLPDSDEARESEIPEHLVREKGHGDDARAPARPDGTRTAPDGESYEIASDQAEHQDRGQSTIEGFDRQP